MIDVDHDARQRQLKQEADDKKKVEEIERRKSLAPPASPAPALKEKEKES